MLIGRTFVDHDEFKTALGEFAGAENVIFRILSSETISNYRKKYEFVEIKDNIK